MFLNRKDIFKRYIRLLKALPLVLVMLSHFLIIAIYAIVKEKLNAKKR